MALTLREIHCEGKNKTKTFPRRRWEKHRVEPEPADKVTVCPGIKLGSENYKGIDEAKSGASPTNSLTDDASQRCYIAHADFFVPIPMLAARSRTPYFQSLVVTSNFKSLHAEDKRKEKQNSQSLIQDVDFPRDMDLMLSYRR